MAASISTGQEEIGTVSRKNGFSFQYQSLEWTLFRIFQCIEQDYLSFQSPQFSTSYTIL